MEGLAAQHCFSGKNGSRVSPALFRKGFMKVVSLFSGGGLGDLGFVMAGCEIVAQVEIDEYCQKILELRYPDAKKFRDIKEIKGSDL